MEDSSVWVVCRWKLLPLWNLSFHGSIKRLYGTWVRGVVCGGVGASEVGKPGWKGGISWFLIIPITSQREGANKESQQLPPTLFPTENSTERELHHLNIKTLGVPLKSGSCHWWWPKFSYFHVVHDFNMLPVAFLGHAQIIDVISPLSGILKNNHLL